MPRHVDRPEMQPDPGPFDEMRRVEPLAGRVETKAVAQAQRNRVRKELVQVGVQLSRAAAHAASPRLTPADRVGSLESVWSAALNTRFRSVSTVNSSNPSSIGSGAPKRQRSCASRPKRPLTVVNASFVARYPCTTPRRSAFRRDWAKTVALASTRLSVVTYRPSSRCHRAGSSA